MIKIKKADGTQEVILELKHDNGDFWYATNTEGVTYQTTLDDIITPQVEDARYQAERWFGIETFENTPPWPFKWEETEQRDRLAEALNRISEYQEVDDEDIKTMAIEALQSLNHKP